MDDAGVDGFTVMLPVRTSVLAFPGEGKFWWEHTTQIFNHNQFLIPNF